MTHAAVFLGAFSIFFSSKINYKNALKSDDSIWKNNDQTGNYMGVVSVIKASRKKMIIVDAF